LLYGRCMRLLSGSLVFLLAICLGSLRGPASAAGLKTQSWRSQPPPDCPFPSSEEIAGVKLTGRHAEYEHADTWYRSWATDGNLYSPYADGTVGGVRVDSKGPHPNTGQAEIVGNNPMSLKIVCLGRHDEKAAPYLGVYPCANLVYNGVWYYGTYATEDGIGPFVGFRYSSDYEKTWIPSGLSPLHNLFQ